MIQFVDVNGKVVGTFNPSDGRVQLDGACSLGIPESLGASSLLDSRIYLFGSAVDIGGSALVQCLPDPQNEGKFLPAQLEIRLDPQSQGDIPVLRIVDQNTDAVILEILKDGTVRGKQFVAIP